MSIAPQSIENNNSIHQFQMYNHFKSIQSMRQQLSLTTHLEKQKPYKRSRITCILQKYLQIDLSLYFQILISLLTIISLLLEDVRMLFIPKQYDLTIDILHLILLGIFLAQIMLSLTMDSYKCSFFFFLDILSTITILLDVMLIQNLFYLISSSDDSLIQISLIITQTKTTRAVARSVRIMKLFRLARVIKMYKSALIANQIKQNTKYELIRKKIQLQNSHKKAQNLMQRSQMAENQDSINQSQSNIIIQKQTKKITNKNNNGKKYAEIKSNLQQQNYNFPQKKQFYKQQKYLYTQKKKSFRKDNQLNLLQTHSQSSISKILSQSTIKKIIIIILIIMLTNLILKTDFYFSVETSWNFLGKNIANFLTNGKISIQQINKIIESKYNKTNLLDVQSQLIIFQTPFLEIKSYNFHDMNYYRISDLQLQEIKIDVQKIMQNYPSLTLKQSKDNSIKILISYEKFNHIDTCTYCNIQGFSISKIAFICVLIIYVLYSFHLHLTELIVQPIQQMINMVRNPMYDKQKSQQQQLKSNYHEVYETQIVKQAIIKIHDRMLMILGELGTKLIYDELFKPKTAQNYLQNNKKKYGIYGLCRINQFQTLMEILGADIYILNNHLSSIIHSSVYRYGGYAIKNYYNGFLVAFLIPETQNQIHHQINTNSNSYLRILCDYAIFSFVKIVAQMFKNQKLLQFCKDVRILKKFGYNFQISLNLTLNIGQAYQGIVGSHYKIDPMFIGQRISTLHRLNNHYQNNCKINQIIFDQDFYMNLTNGMHKFCRKISYIKYNRTKLNKIGNDNDINDIKALYTVDIDVHNISPSKKSRNKLQKRQRMNELQLKRDIIMEYLKDQIEINNYNAQAFVNCKKQLREILKKYITDQMKRRYAIAFSFYANGQWEQSKIHFQEILKIRRSDEPSLIIYNQMKKYKFQCPQNWIKYTIIK